MSQENLLKDLMVPGEGALHAAAGVMQAQSTGVDPFLGQAQNAESHARQSSADSGLGNSATTTSIDELSR